MDGKKASSLEEYFGGVSVVAFTPDDLEVVKGGPDARRAFLDRAVFNRFPAFLQESREYARALKNRNRLLQRGPRGRRLPGCVRRDAGEGRGAPVRAAAGADGGAGAERAGDVRLHRPHRRTRRRTATTPRTWGAWTS